MCNDGESIDYRVDTYSLDIDIKSCVEKVLRLYL